MNIPTEFFHVPLPSFVFLFVLLLNNPPMFFFYSLCFLFYHLLSLSSPPQRSSYFSFSFPPVLHLLHLPHCLSLLSRPGGACRHHGGQNSFRPKSPTVGPTDGTARQCKHHLSISHANTPTLAQSHTSTRVSPCRWPHWCTSTELTPLMPTPPSGWPGCGTSRGYGLG